MATLNLFVTTDEFIDGRQSARRFPPTCVPASIMPSLQPWWRSLSTSPLWPPSCPPISFPSRFFANRLTHRSFRQRVDVCLIVKTSPYRGFSGCFHCAGPAQSFQFSSWSLREKKGNFGPCSIWNWYDWKDNKSLPEWPVCSTINPTKIAKR